MRHRRFSLPAFPQCVLKGARQIKWDFAGITTNTSGGLFDTLNIKTPTIMPKFEIVTVF